MALSSALSQDPPLKAALPQTAHIPQQLAQPTPRSLPHAPPNTPAAPPPTASAPLPSDRLEALIATVHELLAFDWDADTAPDGEAQTLQPTAAAELSSRRARLAELNAVAALQRSTATFQRDKLPLAISLKSTAAPSTADDVQAQVAALAAENAELRRALDEERMRSEAAMTSDAPCADWAAKLRAARDELALEREVRQLERKEQRDETAALRRELRAARAGSAAALASAEKQLLEAKLEREHALQRMREEEEHEGGATDELANERVRGECERAVFKATVADLDGALNLVLRHNNAARLSECPPSAADADVAAAAPAAAPPPARHDQQCQATLDVASSMHAELRRLREELDVASVDMSKREARLIEGQQLVAKEFEAMQSILSTQAYGPALIRLAGERKEALVEASGYRLQVAELSLDLQRLRTEANALGKRNANLVRLQEEPRLL